MINNGIPMINGATYDWASITALIAGVPVMGITAINYADEQDIKNNYGARRMPVSYSKGRITTTAAISLYMEEVEALQMASPNGRLQEIAPFDIVVAYLTESGQVTNHVIKNCKFKKNSREWKEGDGNTVVALELIPSHIKWK